MILNSVRYKYLEVRRWNQISFNTLHTLRLVDDVTEGSTQEAAKMHTWVLPRKVAKMVWIFVQFSIVGYDGCFLGASYYVLKRKHPVSTQEVSRKHP